MAIVSASTGRWELVGPRRPVPYRPSSFDPTGRWHFVDPLADRNTEPYRDDDTMQLVDDLVDCLIVCRSGSTYDAGARLSVTASLMAELDARLPENIFEARDQGYSWDEIAARLAMPESTTRQRYSHYVACRKEMPLDNID
jgi:DNA-directed RNA polymerase specialized sigma24 family protein